jgi:hypothetical protein
LDWIKTELLRQSEKLYQIRKEVKLSEEVNGITGQLQLLIDRRIPQNDTELDPEAADNMHHAILRIRDESGNIILAHTLERSLASLEIVIEIQDTPGLVCTDSRLFCRFWFIQWSNHLFCSGKKFEARMVEGNRAKNRST